MQNFFIVFFYFSFCFVSFRFVSPNTVKPVYSTFSFRPKSLVFVFNPYLSMNGERSQLLHLREFESFFNLVQKLEPDLLLNLYFLFTNNKCHIYTSPTAIALTFENKLTILLSMTIKLFTTYRHTKIAYLQQT